jgi:branched-chain amino acid transport system substrate-binding protein
MEDQVKRKLRPVVGLAVAVAVVSATVGVGTGGASTTRSSANEIVIGATIPLTGAFAAFGAQEKIADTMLVDEVNAKGGIAINGVKEKVKLVILDSKSDPNTTTTQARTLALQDHAIGFFGTIAPPLVIPLSSVSDQLKIPMTHHTPIQAWLGGRTSGWKYSWDVFFNEPQMTTTQFKAANLVKTNKKVVLFTDTDPDGVVMGKLWQSNAPKYGYTIVAHETFPEGTTDFSSYIRDAQSKKAQVLIAQMIPPDAIALWKQMKAAGYQTQVAVCEKCSYNSDWGKALGKVANGTLVADVWSPVFKYPHWQQLLATKSKLGGKMSPGVSGVAISYTVGKVLLDAIAKAGSTDPDKINAAIAATNAVYPTGRVKFTAKHYSAIPALQTQWQNGGTVVVWPKTEGGGTLQAPTPGLG